MGHPGDATKQHLCSVLPLSDTDSDENIIPQAKGHAYATEVRRVNTNAEGNIDLAASSCRTMSRRDTVLALLTNQVGLGVLSLPSVMKTLGLVPGTFAITGLGCLSWYTAFELKLFYDRHPHVLNIVDMARVVGGQSFAIVTALGMMLLVIMTAASATVTFSVALSIISGDALNKTGFIGIGCICCWLLCIPPTARFMSQTGWLSCISILAATVVLISGLVVSGPVDAPEEWTRNLAWFGAPSFKDGLNACLKICYAFSGNVSFVSYMAEMTNPRKDFPVALMVLELVSISFYALVAIAIYSLAGEYTVSPALSSASASYAKIAYGLVIPSVLTKGLAFGYTGIKFSYIEVAKYIGVRRRITMADKKSSLVWMGLVTAFWILSFALSIAIPDFDSILSMTSAVTIGWFTFGISAVFSLHMTTKHYMILANSLLIIGSLFLAGAGLWSSITELRQSKASVRR
jgi:hypothetical protein